MTSPCILLLGCGEDETLRRLEGRLAARGAEALRLDLRQFPERLRLTLDSQGLVAGGRELDCAAACYVARGEVMSPVPCWVPDETEWLALHGDGRFAAAVRARQEARSLRASLLRLLAERLPVVDPPEVHRACWLLPGLLRSWEEQGLPVSPFVAGNDLELVAHFVASAGERCRVRRLGQEPGQEELCDFGWLRRHHLDFDRHPLLVRRAVGTEEPSLAVVLDGHCLAALGRASGDDPPRWQVRALPPAAAQAACAAARQAGATVAGVWLELDETGAPWLLGLDPTPDLAALEDASGRPLVDALAGLLLAVARNAPAAASAPGPRATDSGGRRATAGRQPVNDEQRAAAGDPPLPGPRAERPRIGLAGRVADAELTVLARALLARGAEPVPVELPLFPEQRAIHEAAERARIATAELRSLDAVFLRHTGYRSPLPGEGEPQPDRARWAELLPAYRRFPGDEGESFAFKYALLEILGRRIPVVNPPAAQEVHRTKVWQILHLASAGLPVPPTLAGNDATAAAAFVAAQGGPARVVVKPLAGIYKTCLLAELGLERALSAGPVLLQRYVAGDTVRAYLIGGTLAGAAVILHESGSVDSSVEQQGARPTELPPAALEAGLRAAALLGLAWTGMDFIRDAATGEHFILECNAAAMFAGFSRMTGFDVPAALAGLLLRLAGTRAPG